MTELIKRLLLKAVWLAVVFLGITLISFWVINLAPGKPTDLQTDLNPLITPEAIERLEKLYGLDQPIHVRYRLWLERLVKLDFGNALTGDRRPVWDKISERLPLTVGMNLAAMVLTLALAIPIGVTAAARHNGPFDRASTVFVFLGFAMPGFWLALLLMLGLGIAWPVLPISGVTSLDHATLSPPARAWDIIRHLALPMFIYVFGGLAGMSRYMRSAMLEVLRQDYILTARAKGLSERAVIYRHALRNALLPVITLLGLSVPGLIGGSVIIEQIFSLPGLGQLFYQAVMSRDYPLIMANLVLGAVLTLGGNLLADMGYSLADPRIRSGGGRG
ncbi:Dipeptide transport system permease protein DppB [Fundidesulfovibrio magnetotacticus]|uniref:Dipeptide transport system permease protein DppB n=1 Tax=Fundidesulfovibrio magnetotacticus TaxID=2730080 RepID=A0A6V8LT61_9BACT|nr:ABC transporter permease [Fundidesulfovibrio magnetotacticus]GFK92827.1 Dipeptide transport system permease protein DppB [Fundidesulfovibrio magnetotacticus]